MKKLTCQILAASAILFCLVSAKAATVTVTVPDDAIPANDGANGTFYWALTNAQAGDTIAFNIDSGTYGPGPYFLQVPTNGFPLIYQKHGLTIDGYTQPGALANTNPITGSNSAQLKIVIDGRNGNGRSMDIITYNGTLAKSDPPIDNTLMAGEGTSNPQEFALLGVYRSTNVTIKGLAFLADNLAGQLVTGKGSVFCLSIVPDYGLDTSIKDALEYDAGSIRNWHVAGCWFGVNPTNVTKSGVVWSVMCINFPRRQYDGNPRPDIPNVGGTIGVGAGSANPRAEFNVMAGSGFAFSGDSIRFRVSGNFIWFMPDGVTPYDFSSYDVFLQALWKANAGCITEMGRYGETYASSPVDAKPMVIGTDGDGVNDADEGNLWGPIGGAIKFADNISGDPGGMPTVMSLFHSGQKTWLIAGNRWGINNNGTQFTNCANFIAGTRMVNETPNGNTRFFFGSDFASGRSAATIAAQANHFYNNWPIAIYGNPISLPKGKVVPSFHFQHPHNTEVGSTNGCLSMRGNVFVGMGLSPVNYATNGTLPADSLPILRQFTNFFSAYLDTNAAIIPVLNAGSSDATHLVGTFSPGVGDFTNVIIDVYELDPYGWTNGQKFVFEALTDHATYTNGFPQGKRYIGSQSVPNSGSFNVSLAGMLTLGSADVTVTANYSVSPAGTAWAKTTTSDFSMPITVRPVIQATRSGSNLNVSWEPAGVMYTVQTNASVVSAGTWGNHTAGPVAPPVSVPMGTGTKFFRLKQ